MKCGAAKEWRRSVGPIVWEKKKCYKKSRRKGISYKQWREGKLIGLVTSCVGTAFWNTLLKGKTEIRLDISVIRVCKCVCVWCVCVCGVCVVCVCVCVCVCVSVVCVCVCVCVCVGFVICGCFSNIYILYSDRFYFTLLEVFLTLPEVFPRFFLSYKANGRVNSQRRGTVRTLPN